MASLVQSVANFVTDTHVSAQLFGCAPGNTFIASVTVGSLIASVGTFIISDDVNGVWTNSQVIAQDGSDHCLFVGYLQNQQSAGNPTINASWSGGTFDGGIIVEEVTGIIPSNIIDVSSSATWSIGGANGTVSSPNINTTHSDYVLAALTTNGAGEIGIHDNFAGTNPAPWSNSIVITGQRVISVFADATNGTKHVWNISSGGPASGTTGVVAFVATSAVIPPPMLGQVCL